MPRFSAPKLTPLRGEERRQDRLQPQGDGCSNPRFNAFCFASSERNLGHAFWSKVGGARSPARGNQLTSQIPMVATQNSRSSYWRSSSSYMAAEGGQSCKVGRANRCEAGLRKNSRGLKQTQSLQDLLSRPAVRGEGATRTRRRLGGSEISYRPHFIDAPKKTPSPPPNMGCTIWAAIQGLTPVV